MSIFANRGHECVLISERRLSMIQIGKFIPFPENPLPLRPIAWLKGHPLLVGSVLFFASTTLINLGNYIFNLVLGRQLGPSAFADLSLIVTLMLITTFA